MVLLTSSLTAQNRLPIWPENKIPNFQKANGEEYSPDRDIVSYRNVQEPSIEVLIPSKQSSNGMAVLICPGGGYGGVSYDWEGTDIAKWLNSRGVAGFVLKYRMPQAESVVTPHLAPLQDAQRAIRWIRHNAEKYNVDPNKVGVMGFSAGGHLAASLSTLYNDSTYNPVDEVDQQAKRPDFMMLIYPVISMIKGVTHMGSRNNLLGKNPAEEMVEHYSTELQVNEETPQAFIVHSEDDQAVPIENSIRMYQALTKNKVKATLHFHPTGGHGFGLGLSRKEAPDWAPLANKWLQDLEF